MIAIYLYSYDATVNRKQKNDRTERATRAAIWQFTSARHDDRTTRTAAVIQRHNRSLRATDGDDNVVVNDLQWWNNRQCDGGRRRDRDDGWRRDSADWLGGSNVERWPTSAVGDDGNLQRDWRRRSGTMGPVRQQPASRPATTVNYIRWIRYVPTVSGNLQFGRRRRSSPVRSHDKSGMTTARQPRRSQLLRLKFSKLVDIQDPLSAPAFGFYNVCDVIQFLNDGPNWLIRQRPFRCPVSVAT